MRPPALRNSTEDNDITEAEYSAWLTPSAVYQMLPDSWGWETRLRFIVTRLENGAFRAVALRFTFSDKTLNLFEMPKAVWQKWAFLAGDDFWVTGDLEHWINDRAGHSRRILAEHVRLEPTSVAREIGLATGRPLVAPVTAEPELVRPAREVSPTASAQKVPRADLEAWVQAYGEANPSAPFAQFLTAARHKFPKRRVTERPLRDAIAKFGFTKSRGNPAIKRK